MGGDSLALTGRYLGVFSVSENNNSSIKGSLML